MKNTMRIVFVLMFLLLVTACASSGPKDDTGAFAPEAVTLRLTADNRLNLYNGEPHALSLCVYQLRDPNGLEMTAQNEAGLEELLRCTAFDPSVVAAQRIVVQPAESQIQVLDRAKGAKYIAAVAGYYELEKEKIVKLLAIPEEVVSSGALLTRRKQRVSLPLDVELYLGPDSIQKVGNQAGGE